MYTNKYNSAYLSKHLQGELSTVRYSLYGQYKGRDRRGSNSNNSSTNSSSNNRSSNAGSGNATAGSIVNAAAGGGGSASSSVPRQNPRKNLNVEARPYYTSNEGNNEHMAPNIQQLAESLYPKVQALRPVSSAADAPLSSRHLTCQLL